MKKLILITLFAVGCAGTTANVPTYNPEAAPPVEVAPEPTPEENPFVGAVSFLRTLLTITPADLERVCGEFGGQFTADDDLYTCQKELQGFAIQYVDGKVLGSSILIPATGGQQMADAIAEEVGAPDVVDATAAVWQLEEGVLIFAPVGTIAYVVVLDTTQTLE